MENSGKLKPSSKPDGCGKQKVQDICATSNDTSSNVLEKSRSKFTILEDLYEESKILENIEFLKKKNLRTTEAHDQRRKTREQPKGQQNRGNKGLSDPGPSKTKGEKGNKVGNNMALGQRIRKI